MNNLFFFVATRLPRFQATVLLGTLELPLAAPIRLKKDLLYLKSQVRLEVHLDHTLMQGLFNVHPDNL